MSFYELILFVHILAAIVWIGSGFLIVLLAARAEGANDEASLTKIFQDTGWLSNRLFMPASLTVLLAGLVLTIDAWAFDQLWIVLGLIGYAATFFTGAVVLGPQAKKIGERIAVEGRVSRESMLGMRRVLLLARVDYVVLVTIVAVMALKPTGDDVLLLVALAAFIAAGAIWVLSKVRTLDESTATREPVTS